MSQIKNTLIHLCVTVSFLVAACNNKKDNANYFSDETIKVKIADWDLILTTNQNQKYVKINDSIYLSEHLEFSFEEVSGDQPMTNCYVNHVKVSIYQRDNKINEGTPFQAQNWETVLTHLRTDSDESNMVKYEVVGSSDFGIIEDTEQFICFEYSDKTDLFWSLIVEKETLAFCAVSGRKESNQLWFDFAIDINDCIRVRK